jgi:hypothetical protein
MIFETRGRKRNDAYEEAAELVMSKIDSGSADKQEVVVDLLPLKKLPTFGMEKSAYIAQKFRVSKSFKSLCDVYKDTHKLIVRNNKPNRYRNSVEVPVVHVIPKVLL